MKCVKNRVAALTLAASLILIASASCSSDEPISDETITEQTAMTESVITAPVAEVPDIKYGGEFRILGVEAAAGVQNDEIFAESENGDTLNDAIYNRNRMVEEKYDIKIVKVAASYSGISGNLAKSVMGGEDAYDAVLNTTAGIATAITSNYLTELSDLPYIDINKPWWNTGLMESSEVAGKTYMLMGDISYSWKNTTWALCFNKRLYEENKLTEPYAMVREGKWTMDVLEEHCRNITKDINGDAVLDKNDRWGLLSSKNAGVGLVTSSAIITVEKNKIGSLEYNLINERNINALDRIRELMTNNDIQLRAEDIGGNDIWNEIINIFKEGRALYRISIILDIAGLRDMNDDFGILPLPKYDETQENYYSTYQSWNARAYGVPITVGDKERVSAILEYMAYVSPDTVTKAYYDVTLQRKVTRDEDSSEMLDIIFGSMISDIGLAFELGGLRNTIPNIINSDTANVASELASTKSSIEAAIADFVKAVEKN